MDQPGALRHTPLHALHVELGAKMVPFAGYDMPVNYPAGILAEHQHTRSAAGLFDVSHMGQFRITGASFDAAAAAVEQLCPNDFRSLKQGQQRYGFLTNERGGILDDLMVTRDGEAIRMVVNAACKEADFKHLKANLGPGVELVELADFSLLALQGPKAVAVMARISPGSRQMSFMTGAAFENGGVRCYATRSGYTGEDGFEISVPNAAAVEFARRLLQEPEVKPIGLGARDSLRLEAGLCLYGSDITEKTTPVEAGLSWAIAERRRKDGGFPGDDVLRKQWAAGVARKRVGILPEGKAPARAHTEITDESGREIGEVTSGGFGPSLGKPVAMGYVATASAAIGTPVGLVVRGKPLESKIVKMPFVPHRYHRQ
ncbi:MAG TPA: glycine cleavage system aminomethyltransferase GcvT [Candidatus Cybelea sp.]|nr:glycine cleavage system aminomethyltransferase GcvT [Candidatus Cybelea sp.]